MDLDAQKGHAILTEIKPVTRPQRVEVHLSEADHKLQPLGICLHVDGLRQYVERQVQEQTGVEEA
jgi:hypothetical protein